MRLIQFPTTKRGEDKYNAGEFDQALKEWRPLAKNGVIEAQMKIAYMYENGEGTPRDLVEAKRWYLAAAELNDPYAQYHLAEIYRRGTGTKRSTAKAIRWHLASALQGNPGSQFWIAIMYEDNGKHEESVKWYKEAAEQEIHVAQYKIGYIYIEGIHEKRDLAKARYWIELATHATDVNLAEAAEELWNEHELWKY